VKFRAGTRAADEAAVALIDAIQVLRHRPLAALHLGSCTARRSISAQAATTPQPDIVSSMPFGFTSPVISGISRAVPEST
jgi:hypothetical protein